MKHQDTISQFTDCLSDVEALMRASRLLLNQQKMQLIVLRFPAAAGHGQHR